MNKTYHKINNQYENLDKAKFYLEIGKGLQTVDYLQTNKKLDELINQHLKSEKTIPRLRKK